MRLFFKTLAFCMCLVLMVQAAEISGTIVSGYRILDVKSEQANVNFIVYRGDYIKFDHGLDQATLSMPELQVEKVLPADLESMPYFKMSKAGKVTYKLGDKHGTITIVEYEGPGYRELTADAGMAYLKDTKPLLLDVRTNGEFERAHIEGAMLLPVQELQKRVHELEKYKNQPILIYCASGNRSTVASKILIDRGYQSIANLRYGIKDWIKRGKPTVGTASKK